VPPFLLGRPLRNRNTFCGEMPCFIHSSDGISDVLFVSVLYEGYLLESQYFWKLHSQSERKTTLVATVHGRSERPQMGWDAKSTSVRNSRDSPLDQVHSVGACG